MNRIAINLNNKAIERLQCGNVIGSFQMLSEASSIVSQGGSSHSHVDTSSSTYQFHWEDCSMAFSGKKSSSESVLSSWEGSVPFLFLRALRVTTPNDQDIDKLCTCGFAWVIWYNLGICCSLLGTRLGDRGYNLLRTAFDLYQKVQKRIRYEPRSMHWTILDMAVINNQACIYYDFAMREATSECLHKLAETLFMAPHLRVEDKKNFALNVQILGFDHIAPAA